MFEQSVWQKLLKHEVQRFVNLINIYAHVDCLLFARWLDIERWVHFWASSRDFAKTTNYARSFIDTGSVNG